MAAEVKYRIAAGQDTLRRPDITLIRRGRLPGDKLPSGVIEVAPDLIIEVVSPGNSASEIEEKVKMFLDAGTKLAWVVHPAIRTVSIQRADGTGNMLNAEATISGEAVLPGFMCRVGEFFEID